MIGLYSVDGRQVSARSHAPNLPDFRRHVKHFLARTVNAYGEMA